MHFLIDGTGGSVTTWCMTSQVAPPAEDGDRVLPKKVDIFLRNASVAPNNHHFTVVTPGNLITEVGLF